MRVSQTERCLRISLNIFFDEEDFSITNYSSTSISIRNANYSKEAFIIYSECHFSFVTYIKIYIDNKCMKEISFAKNTVKNIKVLHENGHSLYTNNIINSTEREIHYDDMSRLHSIEGPAIIDFNQDKYYFIHNVQVELPEEFKNNPEIYLQNLDILDND